MFKVVRVALIFKKINILQYYTAYKIKIEIVLIYMYKTIASLQNLLPLLNYVFVHCLRMQAITFVIY